MVLASARRVGRAVPRQLARGWRASGRGARLANLRRRSGWARRTRHAASLLVLGIVASSLVVQAVAERLGSGSTTPSPDQRVAVETSPTGSPVPSPAPPAGSPTGPAALQSSGGLAAAGTTAAPSATAPTAPSTTPSATAPTAPSTTPSPVAVSPTLARGGGPPGPDPTGAPAPAASAAPATPARVPPVKPAAPPVVPTATAAPAPTASPPPAAPAAAPPQPAPAAAGAATPAPGTVAVAPRVARVVVDQAARPALLRAWPSVRALVVGQAPAGATVEVIGEVRGEALAPTTDRWLRVRRQGTIGYVYAPLVE
jgi:hypothetical protein